MRIDVVVAALVFVASASFAEEEASAENAEPKASEVIGEPGEESPISAILRAIQLPEKTLEAREAGVPDEQIIGVLTKARTEGVPASRTEAVLDEGVQAVRRGEDPKNFGHFVNAKLAEGLRGRSLAEAIHAEKAQRKGEAKRAGERGRGRGKEKADQATVEVGRTKEKVEKAAEVAGEPGRPDKPKKAKSSAAPKGKGGQ